MISKRSSLIGALSLTPVLWPVLTALAGCSGGPAILGEERSTEAQKCNHGHPCSPPPPPDSGPPPATGTDAAPDVGVDAGSIATFATRIGENNNTSSRMDLYDMRPTSDGGFIATGHAARMLGNDGLAVAKLGARGDVQWLKVYGEYPDVGGTGFTCVQTSDGGYLIAGGVEYSISAGDTNPWVLKLAADGTVQWNSIYQAPGYDEVARMVALPAGGYLLVGSTASQGAGMGDAWIIKIADNGTIAWQKTYGTPQRDYASDVLALPGGGALVVGVFAGLSALMKVNDDGTVAWQKAFNGASDGGLLTHVQQAADGGYVLEGSHFNTTDGYTPSIVKLDGAGAIQWQKHLAIGSDFGAGLLANADGSVLLAGTINGGPTATAYVPSFTTLTRLNGDGTLAWSRHYDVNAVPADPYVAYAYGLMHLTDGGAVLFGAAADQTNAVSTSYLLKVSPADGNLAPISTSATPAISDDTFTSVPPLVLSIADSAATVGSHTFTFSDDGAAVDPSFITVTHFAP
jgi:hypothetical protein